MTYFDNWDHKGAGVYTIGDMRVSPLLEGYILTAPDFTWVADSLDELEGICDFYSGFSRRSAERREREIPPCREDLGDGFELKGQFHRGASFDIRVTYNGEEVGRYQGFGNSVMATFVLGEDTIQGAEMLDDIARGRGFGDRMRDAAERAIGLKAVPHGRNFTTGSLSEAAAKSWARRAQARPVPGYGNDISVKIRSRMVEQQYGRQSAMEENRRSLTAAMTLAERAGCDVMIGSGNGQAVCGWAVHKGIPVDPSGILDPKTLRQSWQKLTFKQMTFRKADAVVGPWRDDVSPEDLQFATRMTEMMSTKKFDALAERSRSRASSTNPEMSEDHTPSPGVRP